MMTSLPSSPAPSSITRIACGVRGVPMRISRCPVYPGERCEERLTLARLSAHFEGILFHDHVRRRLLDPYMRGRHDPSRVVKRARRDEDQIGRGQRLVPEADAASPATHDIDLAAGIRMLAVAFDLAARL